MIQMETRPIDQTLNRIEEAYPPGMLVWMKRHRRREWAEMLRLEKMINQASWVNDKVGLDNALRGYETFLLDMIRRFKEPRGETGNLFESE